MAVLAGLGLHRGNNWRPVQYGTTQELAAGKLLIAKPELADPNFAESVVLIVHYDDDKGAVGLILNRRSNVPLSKVLPQVKGAREDPVYEGGPVETASAQALLRSREKPEEATKILSDVYASGNKDVIEKLVTSGARPSDFRLYAGYAGWSPGQLQKEIELGGWSVLRATTEIVFDANPDSLWQRLQHDTSTRIAMAAGRSGDECHYWPAVGVGPWPSRFCRLGWAFGNGLRGSISERVAVL